MRRRNARRWCPGRRRTTSPTARRAALRERRPARHPPSPHEVSPAYPASAHGAALDAPGSDGTLPAMPSDRVGPRHRTSAAGRRAPLAHPLRGARLSCNIQPCGCTSERHRDGGPGLRRPCRRDAPRHRHARAPRRGVGVRARAEVRHELCRSPETRRRARTGRSGDQGASRSPAAGPGRRRHHPGRRTAARAVRGDLAGPHRPPGADPRRTHRRRPTMTVVSMTRDPEALTLTIIAELAAPPSRVWQVWADPRRLERWWGPPTWPATFVAHDFTVGGSAHYYMTGPGGEKAHGWWRFVTVEEPRVIEFED